jgi:uncharacterized membrane protein
MRLLWQARQENGLLGQGILKYKEIVKMLKKVLLAVVTFALMLTVALSFAMAEPSTDTSSTDSVSAGEVSSEDVSSEDVSGDSGESDGGNPSDGISSSTSSKTESKFYIKDDSDFYTESLGALGGNASTVVSTFDTSSDATANNSSATAPDKNLAGVEKFAKYIWIPIGLIALCVLVLVCFNRIYKVKYEAIDPRAKKQPHKESPKNTTHRPRD